MTDHRDRPPADLERFFAASREIPRTNHATKAALLARLSSSIEPPPDGGGEPPPSPAQTSPAPAPIPTAPAAVLSWKAGLLATSTFVFGGLSGVAVDRAYRDPPRVVFIERQAPGASGKSADLPAPGPSAATSVPSSASVNTPPLSNPTPVLPLTTLPSPSTASSATSAASAMSAASAASSPSAASAVSAASVASVAPAGKDAALAEERALLERARTALGRGNTSGALEALQHHASEFPRGRMGEEREALWIQALVSSGRTGEARQRLERYRSHFPQSFALPALEAAVGGR